MSPTERTKAKLKAEGWPLIAVVEHWNPFAHIRQDLFGFIDILACRNDELLAIQCTSGSNASARLTKIRENPAHLVWIASPSRRLEVWGWAKRGPRGKRKTWEVRIEILSAAEPDNAGHKQASQRGSTPDRSTNGAAAVE